MAYAEFYFTDRYWPDFGAAELQAAFDWYRTRERRFGRTTSAQVNGDDPEIGRRARVFPGSTRGDRHMLGQRIVTAVILLAILAAAMMSANPWWFVALLALAAACANGNGCD